MDPAHARVEGFVTDEHLGDPVGNRVERDHLAHGREGVVCGSFGRTIRMDRSIFATVGHRGRLFFSDRLGRVKPKGSSHDLSDAEGTAR
ncbi:hypothetical protein GCM10025774_37680 [Microbacterium kyungheense]